MTAVDATAATPFGELHRGPEPLLLPNAWDVTSAVAFARAGFRAVGTSSFGVGASLARPDGERASGEANHHLAQALRALPVPLSVDIEDGYADEPDQVADYVARLAEAGVAGINIEDSTAESLIDAEVHAAKIAAVKDRCPSMFVNARADNYWLGQEATPDAVLARAERYVRAGADGIFLPGLADRETLALAAKMLPVPVNALISPKISLDEFAGLGVRRVSTGSLPYRAAMRAGLGVAEAVRDGTALPDGVPYSELQDMLRNAHHEM
jgi:2-methylisocitrate lyase-like PEP mutase family enzyme